MTYLQALLIGLLQGITELFPVSSLGHSVLVPAWIGGSWMHLANQSATQTSEQSPYLAFIVALHVATALALLVYYRRDWIRIAQGYIQTIRTRRVETSAQRLGLLLIVGTIPVGITGLALEHTFRTVFAKPLPAAIFLTINGGILLVGERLRRRSEVRALATVGAPTVDGSAPAEPGHRTLEALSYKEAGTIGFFQTFALLAGISRSGITLVGGLVRGLDHEDAAHFAFLLATPAIFAAGVLKAPDLFGDAGAHIHGQVIVGMIAAAVAAYVSVSFLSRYFKTRTLTPFAIYCLIAGGLSIVKFA
jgi:undecaprenyl-diphosphatase